MYADFEPGGGSPVELFRFVHGIAEWLGTSADEPFTTAVGTFPPTVISRGQIAANQEARTQSVDVVVEADSDVAQLFARSKPDKPVFLTVFRTHRDDPDAEVVVIFTGEIKSCTFTAYTATLHAVPMQDVVERDLVQLVYQPTCNNALFDNRCGVLRASFTFNHDVTDIQDADSTLGQGTIYTLDAAAAAYFVGPLAALLQGGVAGFGTQKVSITYHSGDVIWTLTPLRDVIIGSTLDVTAGCPKTPEACRDLFNNLARFQGFPFIPQRNPFEGSGGLT